MSYVFLSVLGALCFASHDVVLRRAVFRVSDATIGVLITIPLSVALYLGILAYLGQLQSIFSFSWQSYVFLSAAGIVTYTIGRSLLYNLMKISGSNITNILVTSGVPTISVILGITLLGELLSWELAGGVLLIISGVVITTLNPQMLRGGKGLIAGIPAKAYLLAMGIGVVWGLSPILIKFGLGSSGLSVAGAFIAHLVAMISVVPLLFDERKRTVLVSMKRGSFFYFLITGLFAASANLLRFIALTTGPASIVTPLFSVSPVFALLLSYLLNRKMEIFSRNVIIGTVIVIIGAILLA
ncbi:EamA family transporter [Chloroflexota bacterium]